MAVQQVSIYLLSQESPVKVTYSLLKTTATELLSVSLCFLLVNAKMEKFRMDVTPELHSILEVLELYYENYSESNFPLS
jgi:hypothetical protein